MHFVFKGQVLILEPDFNIRLDVMLGQKQERYQTRDWAVEFLAYGVVALLATVVEQLQMPWLLVPRPRCAVDQQFILEVYLSLVHAMVQSIAFPWQDPFKRAKVHCQESACWYESG